MKKTQKDLSLYIEISEDTLTNWKKNKPKLFQLVWKSWTQLVDSLNKTNLNNLKDK